MDGIIIITTTLRLLRYNKKITNFAAQLTDSKPNTTKCPFFMQNHLQTTPEVTLKLVVQS